MGFKMLMRIWRNVNVDTMSLKTVEGSLEIHGVYFDIIMNGWMYILECLN